MLHFYPIPSLAIGIGIRTSLLLATKVDEQNNKVTNYENDVLIVAFESNTKYKGATSSALRMQPLLSLSYIFNKKKE